MNRHDVKHMSGDSWVLPGLRFDWESWGADGGEAAWWA